MPVLFEEQGGILEPEKMIAAHVKVAQYHGAQVHTGTCIVTPAVMVTIAPIALQCECECRITLHLGMVTKNNLAQVTRP